MRSIFKLTVLSVALSLTGVGAEAKGCLKGAAVGGVAGHVAGHHGVAGAAAGCAIGRHKANKQEAQRQEPKPPTPVTAPASTKP